MAVMAAANRDPNRFLDPDKLDLTRTDNRHVAFGWAAHYCFGAPLARLEGAIAFNTILKRLKNLALVDKKPEWRGNTGLRGLTALRVSFSPGVPLGMAGAGIPAVNARNWTPPPAAAVRCPFPH
jgi:cytochrome P450